MECLQAPAQDAIVAAVSPKRTACKTHCLQRVAKWLVRLMPAIFKIGIAAAPLDRWELYKRDKRWHFMEVWYWGEACTCRQLEIELIAKFKQISGCQKIQDGGDGVRPDRTHECCMYGVFAGAGDGICLSRKRREKLAFSHS